MFGDLILDLQPGQGQQFLVFHADREGQGLSKEGPRRTDLLANAKMAQRRAVPDLGDKSDHEREQGGEKGEWLMRHDTEEQEGRGEHVPWAASKQRLIVGEVFAVRLHADHLFCGSEIVSTGTGTDATISVMIARAALPRKRARVVVSSRWASTLGARRFTSSGWT